MTPFFLASKGRKFLAYSFTLLFWVALVFLIARNLDLIHGTHLGSELYLIIMLAVTGLYLNATVLRFIFYEGSVSLDAVTAIKFSIFGSVATIIPLAGGMVAKFAFLKLNNVKSSAGAKLVSVSAILYICALFLISGFGFFLSNKDSIVLAFLFFFVFAGFWVSSVLVEGKQKFFKSKIFLLQALIIIVDSIRLYLCFKLMALNFKFNDILVVQFSNIASLGGGAIPGGVGLKEMLGSFIAVKINGLIDPEHVFIGMSLNRLVGYFTLFFCLFAVVIYEKRGSLRRYL